MSVGELLILIGLALDVVGIAAISWRTLLVSKERVADLSGTYWDANPHLGPWLLAGRTDMRIGFPALLTGFALQIVGQAL